MRRRSRRTGLFAVVFGVLALLGAAGVRAGTPGSDPANGTWVGGLILDPGPEQLVLWNLPGSGGARGTCIDAHVNGPLTGPYTHTSTVHDPVFGELNHLYASPTTSDIRLAELSALNSHQYDHVSQWEQWSYVVNGQGGMSVADAGAMLDRATHLAGPYVVTIALPSGVRAGPVYTATVTVRSASGDPVPAARVTLAATNAHLSATQVTTNAAGQAAARFTVPTGTTTSYTLRASVQSWPDVWIYTAPNEQTMFSSAPPTTQTGSRSGPIVRDRAIGIVKVAMGDPAHAPVAGYTYRISDAAGRVVVDSVGTAGTPVSLGRLTMGARYTATEIGRPADAALYIPVQASTDFTVPDGSDTWILEANDPRVPSPTLATQVTNELAQPGDRLTDVVTVAGDDAEDGTIQATLYGPVPVPPSGRCTDVTLAGFLAAPAVSVTAPVVGASAHGNGQVRIDGPIVSKPGCYGWAERLTLTPSGATAATPPTAPHESTLVPVPRKPPSSTTPPKPAPTQPGAPTHAPGARPPSTPLANTGTRFPVLPAALIGAGLVACGAALNLAATRKRFARR